MYFIILILFFDNIKNTNFFSKLYAGNKIIWLIDLYVFSHLHTLVIFFFTTVKYKSII